MQYIPSFKQTDNIFAKFANLYTKFNGKVMCYNMLLSGKLVVLHSLLLCSVVDFISSQEYIASLDNMEKCHKPPPKTIPPRMNI